MTSENLPTIVGVTFVLTLLSLVLNVFAISRSNMSDFAAATATGVNATELLDRVAATNARIDALDAKLTAAQAAAPAPAPAPAEATVEAPK